MKITLTHKKPTIAVHKFSSCDGCQLAFLNAGPELLSLAEQVEIKHFVEAGPVDHDEKVDIAFVEGSVSTENERQRIQQVRNNTRYLVTIGACATSGGLQALRNLAHSENWLSAIYASPEYIDSLDTVTAISHHVRVDFELWGCPVSTRQVFEVIRALLYGVVPKIDDEALCLECKRQGNSCTLVTQGQACMGPVTHTGCGALCPRFGRGCYACYGPAENANMHALADCFSGLGLMSGDITRRFHHICSAASPFAEAGERIREKNELT